jgi:hypothetical protein
VCIGFIPQAEETKKYHVKGSFCMSETKANKVEGYLLITLFALSGVLIPN